MRLGRLFRSVSVLALALATPVGLVGGASANDKLVEMSKSEDNWVMPGRTTIRNNYSERTQVNKTNVKQLKPAWTFSSTACSTATRARPGRGWQMYIHTSFPNYTSPSVSTIRATSLAGQAEAEPGRALGCLLRPRQPGAGLLAGDGKTPADPQTLLDGNVAALNANTGETCGRSRFRHQRSARR